MLDTINSRAALVSDAVVTASRQVWLAGLGAAVVTRDWAEREGSTVFRTLVREGTAIESRAFRIVGDRLETSFEQANTLWKRARRNVGTKVQAYADTAATLVRETLPASLPKPSIPGVAKKNAVKRKTTRVSKRTTPRKVAKRSKRVVKA